MNPPSSNPFFVPVLLNHLSWTSKPRYCAATQGSQTSIGVTFCPGQSVHCRSHNSSCSLRAACSKPEASSALEPNTQPCRLTPRRSAVAGTLVKKARTASSKQIETASLRPSRSNALHKDIGVGRSTNSSRSSGIRSPTSIGSFCTRTRSISWRTKRTTFLSDRINEGASSFLSDFGCVDSITACDCADQLGGRDLMTGSN